MFERFTREARSVVRSSQDQAASLASPTLEAEHLLLALTSPAAGPAAAVLSEAGLDREGLLQALDAEFAGTLEEIGVDAEALLAHAQPSTAPARRTPRFGQSAKLALGRSVRAAEERGERRLLPAHILLGLLWAEAGTVPRALRRAAVDPTELAGRMSARMGPR